MSYLGTPRDTVRPRTVYRCFDGDLCLYVGQTVNIDVRMRDHVTKTPWGDLVTRVETTQHPDLREALDIERAEIQRLRPRWNIDGRPPRSDWNACDYVEVIDILRHKPEERYHPGRCKVDFLREEFARRHPEIAALAMPGLADLVPKRQPRAS